VLCARSPGVADSIHLSASSTGLLFRGAPPDGDLRDARMVGESTEQSSMFMRLTAQHTTSSADRCYHHQYRVHSRYYYRLCTR